ncbi:unnamed protein product [Rotaria magnacalcarata]|uniref:Peptidase S9 prolyl oligopeptidase catalytic domain-containing protein n=1 Tax=Rotaria magnacalcarata TaxID=392030 RepID=A0A816UI37_9BILA|nr:unnamed protein product [Rotaria magnacalcarata]CAF2149066.1 unnamed protein product [Rotaria magnacalcarata]CAF4147235.1 unnamed protein product [Rotaria magnacalcarata]CAF4168934.1 unnamed protein product [Rotaria magnacalcarata]
MSTAVFSASINTSINSYLSKSKFKNVCRVSLFFLGALVVFIPCLIIILHSTKDCSTPSPHPPSPPEWNASDYQSNSDYYQNVTSINDFSQVDNLRLDRLSWPRFCPDNGYKIIYLRKQYHMPDSNGSSKTLHYFDLINSIAPVQLTQPIWGINDQQFYCVDNTTILFLSNRTSSGLTQLFQLNLPVDVFNISNFIEPIQITDFPLNIDNLLVNRQATRLAFSCQVYANLSIEDTAAKQSAKKASGRFVYKFDKLFIRHWDEYITGPRHHPFVVSIGRDVHGTFKFTSTPIDILFGIHSDSPTRPFGDAKSQWSFSASGNSFAFTRQHDEKSDVAWSTNLDIYTVDLSMFNQSTICITCDNMAADTDPKYSPTDEHILVYRAQSVPGYESDQFKMKLYDNTKTRTLLDEWDRSIQAATWSNDGQSVFLELGEYGIHAIYRVLNVLTPNATVARISDNLGTWRDANVHPTNDQILLTTYEGIIWPTNIGVITEDATIPITKHNDWLIRKTRLSYVYESFSFIGARNNTVSGWHVAPVNITDQKAPLVFLIHSGPQNSWYDAWSYDWNFQSFASQGYAVVAINFHGSDSYGQNFTDSITGEYGTLPYEDLQLGLSAALKRYKYIDETRAIALGSGYGGYMINWIAGHPEMSQRFRALICHSGIFDVREMAYSTEELWFTEHDAGGFTLYDNPEAYENFNPVNHVANWSQPILIIQGGRDYRVPETQGIGAFTALQRRGIPSRMLYFPDENHWTLNPLNSLVLYQEIFDWIRQWTK